MAYLDEFSSKHCSTAIANTNRNNVTAAIPKKARGQVASSHPDNLNFQIAQQLNDQRARLIDALAEFPITALWLIEQYERQQNKIERIESAAETLQSSKNLEAIRLAFSNCVSPVSHKEETSEGLSDEKKRLKSELKKFSYSFEDLVELVDMIVSVYKYRGLNNPSTSTQTNSNAKLIIKRLEGQEKRWKVNLGKFNDLIKTESPPYDEQFLFLSVNDMQDFFEEVLLAEHNWLNSRLRLTKANSKLVAFIANQYKGSFLSFEDLVQEGHIGLLKAVDRFDPHLGFQFSTYAGYWIRQSISRALSRLERVVRIPCGQVANINKIFRAKEELSSKTGMEVSVKELAAYTKFSEDEINILFSIAQSPLSLESFDDDEEDSSFSPIDYLEQQTFNHSMNNIAEAELERLLENALKILNPRESTIIQHHFGIQDDNEMTLQDIGAELQLTRERVRQIQVKALNKIKLCYGHQLSSFL